MKSINFKFIDDRLNSFILSKQVLSHSYRDLNMEISNFVPRRLRFSNFDFFPEFNSYMKKKRRIILL